MSMISKYIVYLTFYLGFLIYTPTYSKVFLCITAIHVNKQVIIYRFPSILSICHFRIRKFV